MGRREYMEEGTGSEGGKEGKCSEKMKREKKKAEGGRYDSKWKKDECVGEQRAEE